MQLLAVEDFSTIQSLAQYFNGIKRGIEKESLRVSADGHLSQKPHPRALGAPLTNPLITTDYSEALPELITQATDDRLAPLKQLKEIHQFVYQNLDDEMLWATSMPCVMGEEEGIPIARYGTSNSAKMKQIYRIGLGLRYGRFMQTIAGVHYNFSLPQNFWRAYYALEQPDISLQNFISEKYMGLIRNYLRHSWLIPLFFGASPAVCQTFLKTKNVNLNKLIPGTYYGKYATSLRMSDLGYQNKAQSRLNIGYNSLAEYIQGLEKAISTPDAFYKKIGLKSNGKYQQLNENVLQIENEFYSSIRPKRITCSGERPAKALKNRGVEYLEIRSLDINPFSDIGFTQQQICFLDAFLLACLFAKSDAMSIREAGEFSENFKGVVSSGRHPAYCLMLQNRCRPLKEVADSLLQQISKFSTLLDKTYNTQEHIQIIKQLSNQLEDLDSTFSGQVIQIIEQRQDGFFQYAHELSKNIRDNFKQQQLIGEKYQFYQQQADQSHQKKKHTEENDKISFEEFLANYYD